MTLTIILSAYFLTGILSCALAYYFAPDDVPTKSDGYPDSAFTLFFVALWPVFDTVWAWSAFCSIFSHISKAGLRRKKAKEELQRQQELEQARLREELDRIQRELDQQNSPTPVTSSPAPRTRSSGKRCV